MYFLDRNCGFAGRPGAGLTSNQINFDTQGGYKRGGVENPNFRNLWE
jgi:hypothetical protein